MENPTFNPTIEHMDIVERIEHFRRGIAEMLGNAQRRKNCFSPGDTRRYYHEGREDAFLFALQMMDIWLPKTTDSTHRISAHKSVREITR